MNICTTNNNGKIYAGNGVGLGSSHNNSYVDVPLDVTLAPTDNSDPLTSISGTNNTLTFDSGTNTFSCHLESDTGASYRPYMGLKQGVVGGVVYKFKAVITVTSGQCYLRAWEYGNPDNSDTIKYYNETLTAGTHTITFDGNVRSNGEANLIFDGTQEYNCDFTVQMEIQEITAVNTKTLLYYSLEDKEYKAMSDGSAGEELAVNGDFSDGTNGWVPNVSFDLTVNAGVGHGSTPNGSAYVENYTNLNDASKKGRTYALSGDLANCVNPVSVRFRNDSGGYATRVSHSDGHFSDIFVYDGDRRIVFVTSDAGDSFDFDNISVKEALPTDSTYKIDESCNQILLLDQVITQDDLDYLNANVDALMDLYTNRRTHNLSFGKTNFQAYYPCNEGIDTADLWEAIADTIIVIQSYQASCRTTYKNIAYGATGLFYVKDSLGRLTGASTEDKPLIRFNGDGSYVDTNTVIDGSSSDFTLMLSWQHPTTATTKEILFTSGDTGDRVELRYNSDNSVSLEVGQNTFTIALESVTTHAICVTYDKNTKEVYLGIDGNPLSSQSIITFNGVTSSCSLSNDTDSFIGYVGEFILTKTIETESVWQTFWNRIKDD